MQERIWPLQADTALDQEKLVQDDEFVREAYRLFNEFKSATQQYRDRCYENEEFWRGKHWERVGKDSADEPQPVTPVLFSTVELIQSDIMDAYPAPILQGQEAGDDQRAREMTDIIKYILHRRNYRSIYRDKTRQALKFGTSVQEVFWDSTLYSGWGDINIQAWDIRHFYWDSMFEDIQDGRACFKTVWYPLSWYRERYPKLAGHIAPDNDRSDWTGDYDEQAQSVMMLEYWYKKRDLKTGILSVHMAKLAGRVLLEQSEAVRPEGYYAHGMYPFIVEPLYRYDGQAVGMGMIDIFKNLQIQADKLDQILLKNALMSSKVKMIYSRSSNIDPEDLRDWTKEFIPADRVDRDAFQWVQTQPMPLGFMHYQQSKINAIKEESGQNQFSRGEGGKGITAASAIIALQEAGNKRTRMLTDQAFDGYEKLIRMVIELVVEHYTEQRRFRIRGQWPESDRWVIYPPEGADAEEQAIARELEFDVSVHVEKYNPLKTLEMNQFALELRKMGTIDDRQMLEMMNFEGKDKLMADKFGQAGEQLDEQAALLQRLLGQPMA